MQNFPGCRIAIIGPSNSGKSTLAARMSRALGLPLLHLDQIAHKPDSKWERCSDAELVARQDEFLNGNSQWVIEGNYSVCMAERLRRADTVIWCDPPLAGCLWRYFWRSVKADAHRAGGLAGARGEFSWKLVRYTVRNYPQNAKKYAALLQQYPHLQVMHFKKFFAVKKFGEIF